MEILMIPHKKTWVSMVQGDGSPSKKGQNDIEIGVMLSHKQHR